MKKYLFLLVACFFVLNIFGEGKKIKNIILMIPDGTSLATYSSARWYQWYNNPDKPSLNIDPFICGTMLTYSSNAPIGDSAPTTSCYMTGIPSLAGYVSTYPVADKENDMSPMDPEKAYQPLMTVLEAAKIEKKISTGLVVTCEFPHATPADCSAHSYKRSKYEWIAPQMVHNGIDVVFAGGTKIINEECKNYLKGEGYGVFLNDVNGFRTYKGNKIWALFHDYDMPYDLDRDSTLTPSLAEMTGKAIGKLSQNQNGFFLMVEGSKIDWAAHANDAIAMITETLAFDKACGVALDFARKNEETIVIIVSDHGNSGISIGSGRCADYSKLTKDDLFKNISGYKITAENLTRKIHETMPDDLKSLFKEYTNIDLSDKDVKNILSSEDYKKSELSNDERMKGTNLKKVITGILNEKTCFGFTTGGHTGEEVLLAIYDPSGKRPTGLMRNTELAGYMSRSLKLSKPMPEYTKKYFAKHPEVFHGCEYKIRKSGSKDSLPVLEVKKGKNELQISPNTNIVVFNGKEIKLNSVIVYVDKNDTFYLPDSLKNLLVESKK